MNVLQQGADQPGTIIFLHIPKTAGLTMVSILEREYPPDQIFLFRKRANPPRDRQAFLNESETFRSQLKLIRGHLAFGIHADLKQPSTYFTLLRDPVERVVSHYYYVLQNPTHHLYDKVRGMSLSDYVTSGVTREVRNGQTNMVAGMAASEDSGSDQDRLNQAKENLQQYFSVVGTTERFDETLILLREAFGWSLPVYSRQNVTQNRPQVSSLSAQELAVIRAYNSLDLALYEYANQLLDQKIDACPFFGLKLAYFKLRNRWYNRRSHS